MPNLDHCRMKGEILWTKIKYQLMSYTNMKLLDDLFWEYDRLSSSGKAQLDEIATS